MIALAAAAVAVSFSPNPSHFGELVTATVRGEGIPSFAPFSIREHHGATYRIQCLDPVCVPGPGARVIRVAGRRVVIVPRTTAAEVSRPLRSFRRQTDLPPTSYRIRPAVLRTVLVGGAALLVALAVASAWPLLRRLVPRSVDRRTALERALDLARASLGRRPDDRRRALDLLGRALGARTTATDALELAWSRPDPERPTVEQLLERVEEPR